MLNTFANQLLKLRGRPILRARPLCVWSAVQFQTCKKRSIGIMSVFQNYSCFSTSLNTCGPSASLNTYGTKELLASTIQVKNTTSTLISKLEEDQKKKNRQLARDNTWNLIQPPKLRLGVLDWSGTIADIFSNAPNLALVLLFKRHGFSITMKEARAPMGVSKLDHVKELCNIPRIQQEIYKRRVTTEKMVTYIYNDYIDVQAQVLRDYPQLTKTMSNADVTIEYWLKRQLGMSIGVTTGFPHKISERFLLAAREQGVYVDQCLPADQISKGRPDPEGILSLMSHFGCKNFETIKVGDTVGDMKEGKNAGTWVVGVYETSSYMGIDSIGEADGLSPEEFKKKSEYSKNMLLDSKVHRECNRYIDFLVPSISYLPVVCHNINLRLKNGCLPGQFETIIV
jgi:phosphonoacetaldehyde hydrolase